MKEFRGRGYAQQAMRLAEEIHGNSRCEFDSLFKIKDIVMRRNVAVFSGNMTHYGDMSQRVRWVLEVFAPNIGVYSIDEASLDLREITNIDFDEYAKRISAQC